MPEHPLKIYEALDPKLLNLMNDTQKLALADGALPRKVKLLIAMVKFSYGCFRQNLTGGIYG